jgi:hypothetical protein
MPIDGLSGNELFGVVERMQKLFDDCGPQPGQYERFFEKLHGPGWKERALANGPPQDHLVYVNRLRDLEERVRRIERHLKLEAAGE